MNWSPDLIIFLGLIVISCVVLNVSGTHNMNPKHKD
jgi:hypothetical protein